MKLHVNFKRHNPDYNEEYAKEYPYLQDKGENPKFAWERELIVDDVDKVSIINNGSYSFKAMIKGDDEIKVSALGMTILGFFKDDNLLGQFAVSKSLLESTYQNYIGKYDITRFYFYLKSDGFHVRVGDNAYISVKELPEEIAHFYSMDDI